MSEFIAAMLPAVFFWTLPFAPAFYAALADIVENLTKPVHGRIVGRVSRNAGTAVRSARADLRELADPASGDQEAA